MKLNVELEPGVLAGAAAAATAAKLEEAISEKGYAIWVLAGGTSPALAYRELASDFAFSVEWSRVYGLIGDERCVPLDDADSNIGGIQKLVRGSAGIREMQLLVPRWIGSPESMRGDYEQQILRLTKSLGVNKFCPDVTWLGIGEDGHTLSHFPGKNSLEFDTTLVQYVSDSPKPPSDRITLSLGALQCSALTLVFAIGAGKRDAVHAILRDSESRPAGMLASHISSMGGQVDWLVDLDALLPSER